MKREVKLRRIWTVALAIAIVPSVIMSQQGSSPWESPFSWITYSENREYVFVLLSSNDIDEYIERTVEAQRKAGATVEELTSFRRKLSSDLESERAVRKKYAVNGLYRVSDPKLPVVNADNFPKETDLIFVSNDGTYVVGLNQHVARDMTVGHSPDLLVKTPQYALFTLVSNSAPRCSFTLSDVLTEKDRLGIGSHGFSWTDEKPIFDSANKVLRIRKLNGDRLGFELIDCKLVNERSNNREEENARDSCGGALVLLILFLVGVTRQ